MNSHLCGLTTSESARSKPGVRRIGSGTHAAPSRRTRRRRAARRRSPRPGSAISGHGVDRRRRRRADSRPRPRRHRSRLSGVHAHAEGFVRREPWRISRPRMRQARSTDEWACSEATYDSAGRAAQCAPRHRAASVEVDALVLDVPVPLRAAVRAAGTIHEKRQAPRSSVTAGEVPPEHAVRIERRRQQLGQDARLRGGDRESRRRSAGGSNVLCRAAARRSRSASTAENGSASSGGEGGKLRADVAWGRPWTSRAARARLRDSRPSSRSLRGRRRGTAPESIMARKRLPCARGRGRGRTRVPQGSDTDLRRRSRSEGELNAPGKETVQPGAVGRRGFRDRNCVEAGAPRGPRRPSRRPGKPRSRPCRGCWPGRARLASRPW